MRLPIIASTSKTFEPSSSDESAEARKSLHGRSVKAITSIFVFPVPLLHCAYHNALFSFLLVGVKPYESSVFFLLPFWPMFSSVASQHSSCVLTSSSCSFALPILRPLPRPISLLVFLSSFLSFFFSFLLQFCVVLLPFAP